MRKGTRVQTPEGPGTFDGKASIRGMCYVYLDSGLTVDGKPVAELLWEKDCVEVESDKPTERIRKRQKRN